MSRGTAELKEAEKELASWASLDLAVAKPTADTAPFEQVVGLLGESEAADEKTWPHRRTWDVSVEKNFLSSFTRTKKQLKLDPVLYGEAGVFV